MDWKIEIAKVSNGFILRQAETGVDENDLDISVVCENVFQEKDENDDTNKDHIIDMFYHIIEYFGESGNKHDSRRLEIRYIKGEYFKMKEE